MAKHHTFPREAVFPSWWPNAISEQVGIIVENFELRKFDDTTVEVPAATNSALVVVGIDGKWRFRSSTVSRAHPGGAAGTYPIFVVAKENSIASTPLPFTDNTDYNFDLRIEPPGGTPALAGGIVDFYRKVGEAVWDGAKITNVRQLVGQVSTRPAEPTARRADEVALRAKGAASQTADFFRVEDSAGAAVVRVDLNGTLSGKQFVSEPTTSGTGAYHVRRPGDSQYRFVVLDNGQHEWGSGSAARDILLYRSAAAVLACDGSFRIGGALDHEGTTVGFYGVTPVARSAAYSVSNASADRTFNASVTSIDELADVLGTLIADLKATGIIG